MAFADDLARMQGAVYARNGVAAVITLADARSASITVLPVAPDVRPDMGNPFDKPSATAAFCIKARVAELAGLGFTEADPVGGVDLLIWRGATIQYQGRARPVLRPVSFAAGDTRKTEFLIDLG